MFMMFRLHLRVNLKMIIMIIIYCMTVIGCKSDCNSLSIAIFKNKNKNVYKSLEI